MEDNIMETIFLSCESEAKNKTLIFYSLPVHLFNQNKFFFGCQVSNVPARNTRD